MFFLFSPRSTKAISIVTHKKHEDFHHVKSAKATRIKDSIIDLM